MHAATIGLAASRGQTAVPAQRRIVTFRAVNTQGLMGRFITTPRPIWNSTRGKKGPGTEQHR